MIRSDQEFSKRVEAAVQAIEAQTDAEVVVVAAERSGTYRDVSAMFGAGIAWFVLVIMAAIPELLNPIGVAFEIALVWGAATWLAGAPPLLRRVVPKARQLRQVSEAASMEFHREAVYATPGRIGFLVYVSVLEGRVELVPDVGIDAKVPRGRWAEAQNAFSHQDLDQFLAGLAKVGAILAEAVPRTGTADALELADAPRLRF